MGALGEVCPPDTREQKQHLSSIGGPARPADLISGISRASDTIRAMPLPSKDQVTERLRAVIDPELRRSIVDLGMVRSIEIADGGRVDVVVSLTTPGCPIRSHFQQAVAQQVSELDGVSEVGVSFDVLSDEEKGKLAQALGRPSGLPEGALAQVKNVVCVASGKGGVGKSTMTANLAAALRAEGHSTGVLDCDVYGYSIPRMLGVNRKPDVNAERKIIPIEAAGGIRVMSIGFFLEENAAVVWRGPMLHKAIQQRSWRMSTGGSWITCCSTCPRARSRRLDDARARRREGAVVRRLARGASGPGEVLPSTAGKVDLELLGVIENMAGFTTPDGERFTIFGEAAASLADEWGFPCSARCRSRRSFASTPTPACPWRWTSPTPPRRGQFATRRAGSSPPRPRSCR